MAALLFRIVLLLGLLGAISAVSRIIGGNRAAEGKYPYLVSLRLDGIHVCGGSIVDKRWILTGAHCVKGRDESKFTVMAGTNSKRGSESSGAKFFNATYAVAHEDFDFGWNTQNDIALIRVDPEIEFDARIQPIELTRVDVNEVGTPVVLSGWGNVEVGVPTNDLQEIELEISSPSRCESVWRFLPYIVSGKRQICTLTRYGKGVCKGDSGGPLVVADDGGAGGVQIGVVSYGRACAKGIPDVYTKVYSYLGWIDEQVKKYD